MKQAMIFMTSSAFLFSIMNLLVKLLGDTIPSTEISFYRGLIGSIAVLVYMYVKRINFSKNDLGFLTLRGIFGGLGNLFNFISLAKLKLADASILFQLSGIFVFIFSALFLKEKIPKGAGKWLLLILGAVIIMVNPWTYSSFSMYAFYAIAGAAFSAAAYTTIRKISINGGHSTYEIMFYFLVSTMLVGGFFMMDNYVAPNLYQWSLLILIGAVSTFAQFFMTGGFVVTNAVVAQFMQYIGIFFNAFWGYAVFGETLSLIVVFAGITLFISSIMLSRLKEEQVS